MDYLVIAYLAGVGIFAHMFDRHVAEKHKREFQPLIILVVSVLWPIWILKTFIGQK